MHSIKVRSGKSCDNALGKPVIDSGRENVVKERKTVLQCNSANTNTSSHTTASIISPKPNECENVSHVT